MANKISWTEEGIYIKYSANVDFQELISVNRVISADARYGSLKYNLSDFTEVETFEMSEGNIEMISTLHHIPSVWNPSMKLAIIANTSFVNQFDFY